MENFQIASNFNLLSKLMDIHGENSFKSKSYATAAFTIEKLPAELENFDLKKIAAIKNIGENIAQKIVEQIQTGKLSLLNEYLDKTPDGIIDMLRIKGLGPKKVHILWKELGIESVSELLDACHENRLSVLKGFGEKTQQNIKETIEFLSTHEGRFLFAQIDGYASSLLQELKSHFKGELFSFTGDLLRQLEIVDQIEIVTAANREQLTGFLVTKGFESEVESDLFTSFRNSENLQLMCYFASSEEYYAIVFERSCSSEFLSEWRSAFPAQSLPKSEDEIFLQAGTDYIPPYMREDPVTIVMAKQHKMPPVLQPNEIKGIIHSHSNWSDGASEIEVMAKSAQTKGFAYLVLSDHSKSAFYANGLLPERVIAQHRQIDELNEQLSPFRIFKGIESDILTDGSLDYSDDILSTFEVVIASIHSNQKMDEEKATKRLIKAIENPYTNILGHMTGRLLLKRKGYPVNHRKVIDACAANHVVIELNANPRRLDIDWRWLKYCLEKEVMISINPDAHSIDEFDNVRYGVLVAQKAGLTRFQNLSSFNLSAFESFVSNQNRKRVLA